MLNKAIPIDHLAVGESALVDDILGDPDHVHRLKEFGLRDGTHVEMFRPGNPCIIRMAGNKVCLRFDRLLRVMVRPAVGPG